MAPPWSRFGKRLIMFEKKTVPLTKVVPIAKTKTVPKWGPSCGHENGSTLEPFRLLFFLSVKLRELPQSWKFYWTQQMYVSIFPAVHTPDTSCHHGGSLKLISAKRINLVPLEQFPHKPMRMYHGGLLKCELEDTISIHTHRVVMTLLEWHKIYNLGWDEPHGLPVVALILIELYKESTVTGAPWTRK